MNKGLRFRVKAVSNIEAEDLGDDWIVVELDDAAWEELCAHVSLYNTFDEIDKQAGNVGGEVVKTLHFYGKAEHPTTENRDGTIVQLPSLLGEEN